MVSLLISECVNFGFNIPCQIRSVGKKNTYFLHHLNLKPK